MDSKERAIYENKIKEELKKEKLSAKELVERISPNHSESLKIRRTLKDMNHYGEVISDGERATTKYYLINVDYEDNNEDEYI